MSGYYYGQNQRSKVIFKRFFLIIFISASCRLILFFRRRIRASLFLLSLLFITKKKCIKITVFKICYVFYTRMFLKILKWKKIKDSRRDYVIQVTDVILKVWIWKHFTAVLFLRFLLVAGLESLRYRNVILSLFIAAKDLREKITTGNDMNRKIWLKIKEISSLQKDILIILSPSIIVKFNNVGLKIQVGCCIIRSVVTLVGYGWNVEYNCVAHACW